MKRAFSLLELLLVIIILGVILSLVKFYPKNDQRIYQALKQILNDLSYTRNLALMQGAFRINSTQIATKDEWFKARWQLYFIRSAWATENEQTYTIFLDKNGDGNANLGRTAINLDREIAYDLLDHLKFMNSGQSGVISKSDPRASARFNIEKSYGVSKVEFKGACAGFTRISFDKYGRLHSPLRTATKPYEKLIFHKNTPCVIRLSNDLKQTACIVLDPLSGFAFIPAFEANKKQFIGLGNKKIECEKI